MIPKYAMIEPTTVCNLKCISCFREDMIKSKKISVGSFSLESLEKIHSQLPNLEHIRFHGMGELFLLKNHVEFIEKLRQLYPKAWVELVTNGQYEYTDVAKIAKLINRLTFSMSGFDKKSYEEHHINGKWERFIDNIGKFAKFKDSISLEINYVCTVSNSKNLLLALETCKQLGINVLRINLYQDWGEKNELSMQVMKDNVNDIQQTIQKGKDAGLNVLLMGNSSFDVSGCQWMDERILIAYNGDILPCCMRPDHHLSLGNLFKDNIENIWNSNKTQNLRKLRSKNNLDFCRHCPYKENIPILKECL